MTARILIELNGPFKEEDLDLLAAVSMMTLALAQRTGAITRPDEEEEPADPDPGQAPPQPGGIVN